MQQEKLRKIIREILKEEDETLYQTSSKLNLTTPEEAGKKREKYYNDYYLFLKNKIEEEEGKTQRNKVKKRIISQEKSRLKKEKDAHGKLVNKDYIKHLDLGPSEREIELIEDLIKKLSSVK